MAAASQVLNTTELLEAILYELPTRDLLFAQRINKEWKALIDNSTKLQQALFFRPIPVEALTVHGTWLTTEEERRKWSIIEGKRMGLGAEKALLNPLLRPYFEFLANIEPVTYIDPSTMTECVVVPQKQHSTLIRDVSKATITHPSWYAPTASWKRMMPTQPPVHRTFIVFLTRDEDWRFEWIPEGVFKMEDIEAEIMKAWERFKRWDYSVLRLNFTFMGEHILRSNHDLDTLTKYYKKRAAGDENARCKLSQDEKSDSEDEEQIEDGEADKDEEEDENGEQSEDEEQNENGNQNEDDENEEHGGDAEHINTAESGWTLVSGSGMKKPVAQSSKEDSELKLNMEEDTEEDMEDDAAFAMAMTSHGLRRS